jgi:hypothetical protein
MLATAFAVAANWTISEAESGNAGSAAKADNSAEALAKALAEAMPLTSSAGTASDIEIGGMPSAASRAADKFCAQKQPILDRFALLAC